MNPVSTIETETWLIYVSQLTVNDVAAIARRQREINNQQQY